MNNLGLGYRRLGKLAEAERWYTETLVLRRRVLGADMVSFAETTAMGLLALQGNRSANLKLSLKCVQDHLDTTSSPIAKAWLTICLRCWGQAVAPPDESVPAGNDILITALEAIAAPAGMHRLFRLEA